MFGYCLLESYFFPVRNRQRVDSEGRGTGKSRWMGNCKQDTLYKKRISFWGQVFNTRFLFNSGHPGSHSVDGLSSNSKKLPFSVF